jgi:hypothetical protein
LALAARARFAHGMGISMLAAVVVAGIVAAAVLLRR